MWNTVLHCRVLLIFNEEEILSSFFIAQMKGVNVCLKNLNLKKWLP